MKKKLIFSLGAGIITGFFILVMLFQILGLTISDKVIMESCQGDYVKYGSYDPYCLNIIKQSQPLSSKHIILISRKGDLNYGHVLSYIDPYPVSEDEIRKTRVLWTAEGIEMTFPLGQKLFIQKERFIGGR